MIESFEEEIKDLKSKIKGLNKLIKEAKGPTAGKKQASYQTSIVKLEKEIKEKEKELKSSMIQDPPEEDSPVEEKPKFSGPLEWKKYTIEEILKAQDDCLLVGHDPETNLALIKSKVK